ncbi:MAG: Glycosyltransferase [Parcubacteria group bacterium Gr01-1014_18]|nr:MAG: Glycosyltransferase [Parcubacteria group bacterium Greene0416_36]TSC81031.1 MAG: Glycosyltransferase [Parcubacteria group bacterium Gr01-1014_18]TSC98953.1 MAG: Glycosyltransferase [Parcubacteria group bacterium Greene1014_20]TSD06755.1 MAG: Glycosyltransferase [Parcubacteria group bacterium Greene0714_2]
MRVYMIGQKGIPALSGGVERHVDELAIRLAERGHSVYVYCRAGYSKGKSVTLYKGVNLIYLPTIYSKHLEAIVHTFLASVHVLFRKADVVHYHAIGPSSLLWIPRIFKPTAKVIATFHCQDYKHQKWGLLARAYLHLGEWMLCRLAHRIIAVSKTIQQYVRGTYGRESDYIPNGVPDFKKITAGSELAKWNLRPNEYFVAVSRFVQHKGLHYLIDAYRQLKTDKKLVLVGDASYTDSYKQLLLDKAAGDSNIIFTGSLSGDHLLEVFQNAYVFVQPSEAEGLSVALLEAMKMGKCSVISNIPENLEVVGDEGVSFESKNVADLAAKLQYVLDYPQVVAQKATASYTIAAKDYNWENIVSSIESLYA